MASPSPAIGGAIVGLRIFIDTHPIKSESRSFLDRLLFKGLPNEWI
jgi:hypothetical protein